MMTMTQTTKPSRAAEFFGTCQCCGAVQKLPKGVLSLHGYTVSHGFFAGVCRGARYQPFEKSCDQVKRYIDEAILAMSQLEAQRAAILSETKIAYVHVYVGFQGKGRSSYRWMTLPVTAELNDYSTFKSYRFYVDAPSARHNGTVRKTEVERFDCQLSEDKGQGAEAAAAGCVAKMNAEYVRVSIDKRIAQLLRYVGWQQARVSAWKEADLMPVKPKKVETAFAAESIDA